MHPHSSDRAYLITDTNKFYHTTDAGRFWNTYNTPSPPNTFGAQVLRFQFESDYLIWVGNVGCESGGDRCRAEAQYSHDHGRTWNFVEDYVVNCDWARDDKLRVDATQILCESYENKQGSQVFFGRDNNALQLVSGMDFYKKKTKLFDHVVGFTKFSEFLIVAEVGFWFWFCGPLVDWFLYHSTSRRGARLTFRYHLMDRRLHQGSSLLTCIQILTYVDSLALTFNPFEMADHVS